MFTIDDLMMNCQNENDHLSLDFEHDLKIIFIFQYFIKKEKQK